MTDIAEKYMMVHCDDSFRALQALGDGSVDIIITDPPYDSHCQSNQMSGSTLARVHVPFQALEDYAFTSDLVRVSRRWALCFTTIEGLGAIRGVCGDAYMRGGIWYKPNSMGQLTGDRPACACEGIACLHRVGKRRWHGRGSYGLWTCNGTRGEPGRHPNQKPLDLLIELVLLFTDPGDVVLDPFAGSGRVGEAALLCGRRFVGFDRDVVWVDRARRRLAWAAARYGRDTEIGTGRCRTVRKS
jgi:site-specific DNA-methyltransferase (adenine-specific)